MVLYICDGRKACASSVSCVYSRSGDGQCRHTKDPEYALNGTCSDPENYPERFSVYRCREYRWRADYIEMGANYGGQEMD